MSQDIRRREDGFTLIELIVTIVILSVIIVPLANFVIEYFLNEAQTNYRLSDSHDVQIVNAYFSQDVSNSGVRTSSANSTPQQSIWTSSNPPPGFYCGQGAGTLVALFQWDTGVNVGAAAQPQNAAAYVTTGSSPFTLVRVSCPASGTTTQAVVAHNITSSTVNCFAAIPPSTPVSGCGSTTRYVQLTLNVQSGSTDKAGVSVTLVGQRRQT